MVPLRVLVKINQHKKEGAHQNPTPAHLSHPCHVTSCQCRHTPHQAAPPSYGNLLFSVAYFRELPDQLCNQSPFLPLVRPVQNSAEGKARKVHFASAAAAALVASDIGSRRGRLFPDKEAHFPYFMCKSVMLS